MISNLTVRSLTQEERKTTYKQYMKHDFPKNELRPLHMIESLVEKGDYYTYGIFENERFVAYAYIYRYYVVLYAVFVCNLGVLCC